MRLWIRRLTLDPTRVPAAATSCEVRTALPPHNQHHFVSVQLSMTCDERTCDAMKAGRKTGLWLAVWTIAMLAVACSGSASKPKPKPTTRSGTLTGSARPCFGAAMPAAQIAALKVALTVDIANDRGQRVARRILHASGQAAYRDPLPFSLGLPVGRYTVSSPPDVSQTVQITAGKTSQVALISLCQ